MKITRDIVWVSFPGPVVWEVSCRREGWDGSEIRQTYPSCRTVSPGGQPGPELVSLKTKAEFWPMSLSPPPSISWSMVPSKIYGFEISHANIYRTVRGRGCLFWTGSGWTRPLTWWACPGAGGSPPCHASWPGTCTGVCFLIPRSRKLIKLTLTWWCPTVSAPRMPWGLSGSQKGCSSPLPSSRSYSSLSENPQCCCCC